MKKKVYRAEAGILLNPTDKEFDYYSKVYDQKYGYYDTNLGYYFSLADAIRFIESEIELHNENYGIITADFLNLTPDEVHEITADTWYSGDWNAFSDDDIIYKAINA